jgi:hypothetical protein
MSKLVKGLFLVGGIIFHHMHSLLVKFDGNSAPGFSEIFELANNSWFAGPGNEKGDRAQTDERVNPGVL